MDGRTSRSRRHGRLGNFLLGNWIIAASFLCVLQQLARRSNARRECGAGGRETSEAVTEQRPIIDIFAASAVAAISIGFGGTVVSGPVAKYNVEDGMTVP